jgi:cell division septal protein FtsQ
MLQKCCKTLLFFTVFLYGFVAFTANAKIIIEGNERVSREEIISHLDVEGLKTSTKLAVFQMLKSVTKAEM